MGGVWIISETTLYRAMQAETLFCNSVNQAGTMFLISPSEVERGPLAENVFKKPANYICCSH